MRPTFVEYVCVVASSRSTDQRQNSAHGDVRAMLSTKRKLPPWQRYGKGKAGKSGLDLVAQYNKKRKKRVKVEVDQRDADIEMEMVDELVEATKALGRPRCSVVSGLEMLAVAEAVLEAERVVAAAIACAIDVVTKESAGVVEAERESGGEEGPRHVVDEVVDHFDHVVAEVVDKAVDHVVAEVVDEVVDHVVAEVDKAVDHVVAEVVTRVPKVAKRKVDRVAKVADARCEHVLEANGGVMGCTLPAYHEGPHNNCEAGMRRRRKVRC